MPQVNLYIPEKKNISTNQSLNLNGHVTCYLPNYSFTNLKLRAAVSQVSLAEPWARSLERGSLAERLMATLNEPGIQLKRTK